MHQSLNHDKPGAASGQSAGADSRLTVWVVCVVLAALTLAVFGRTTRFGFVNYDDASFVYNSPTVTNGLTAAGVAEAFTHGSTGFWDPLTTLSHMADCQLYGLNAGGHHLTNVLLHAASAVLLFLALHRLTGALWPSAFVAAVFAIHPLRVESVAWVAERKDVLSGFFFMLTLGAYARYAEAPKLSRMVVLWFVLGLMSKVMLVTVPFVLLLLDYWPLGRISLLQRGGAGAWTALRSRVILEKMPLLALSAASCVVGVLAQKVTGTISSLGSSPLYLRLENAVVSLAAYIGQMFCPTGLAALYPYPMHGLSAGKVLTAIVLVAAISVASVCCRRTRPYLLTGWLWYLVMLLPVIGLIRAGPQARADRYTYLPQIGLYLALTWLAVSWCNNRRGRQRVLGGIAALVVTALSVSAFNQTSYWQDSGHLWRRDLDCVPDNSIARNNLGLFLADSGRKDEAILEFRKAIKLDPDLAEPHNNLGSALAEKGRMNEAIDEFRNAFQLQPGYARARINLGLALHQTGQWEELYNFGAVLLQQGRIDEAIAQFQDALTINPGFGRARLALELVAWDLATSPDDTKRNGAKAVELAQQLTNAPTGGDPTCLATLAAAFAETGRFADATAAAERARELALAQTNSALAAFVQQQLADYQAGRPFRDVSPTNAPAQR
jgi:Tfp pilus assembly protein PilF